VSEVEGKMRKVQDEWGQRRSLEFSLKFGEYDSVLKTQTRAIEEEKLSIKQEFTNLQTELKKVQSTEIAKSLSGLSATSKIYLQGVQENMKAGLSTIANIRKELEVLQKAYEEQTSLAVNQEKYSAFQNQLEVKLHLWTAEKNSAIFTKFQEHGKEANAILQLVKDLEGSLQSKFSKESLQTFFKDVETRVIASNEFWKERNTKSLQTRMDDATAYLRYEIKTLVEKSKTNLLATEEELKISLQAWIQNEQTRINASLQSLKKATEEELKFNLQIWVQKEQAHIETLLKEAEQERNNSQYALKTDINTALKHSLENTKSFVDKMLGDIRLSNSLILASNPASKPASKPVLKDSKYTSLSKCFYTAIIAGSNQEHDILSRINPPPGWDAICFTNLKNLDNNGWMIIPIECTQKTPALDVKYIKWMSHKVLEDYDVVVWLDAYIAPSSRAGDQLEKWTLELVDKEKSIAHRPHAERNCVWEECDAVIKAKRDTNTNVEGLKRRITDLKMPKQFGLFDTNVMIKLHKNLECQKISEAIFDNLKIDTVRDQLVVTPTYYREKFTAFAKINLLSVFEKTGKHVRKSV